VHDANRLVQQMFVEHARGAEVGLQTQPGVQPSVQPSL
jgi:hypothetical protein